MEYVELSDKTISQVSIFLKDSTSRTRLNQTRPINQIKILIQNFDLELNVPIDTMLKDTVIPSRANSKK